MATDHQIDREKRSVLHKLRKYGDGGVGEYFMLAGFTSYGRQIRLAAIKALLIEGKIERCAGYALRLRKVGGV